MAQDYKDGDRHIDVVAVLGEETVTDWQATITDLCGHMERELYYQGSDVVRFFYCGACDWNPNDVGLHHVRMINSF